MLFEQLPLKADEPPAAVPLAAEHLSEAASNAPKTVLASLGPVRNVDRLEPDQPPMRFAVNGVTLIYGPNAAGKSGYCRITKQLCRSLSPGALRGNVFDGAQSPPAEVGLAFRVGEDEEPKTEMAWRGNDPPPPELARISVFDTASARVYVDKERKIEFLPYELDLLNKLGLAARALDKGFNTTPETQIRCLPRVRVRSTSSKTRLGRTFISGRRTLSSKEPMLSPTNPRWSRTR